MDEQQSKLDTAQIAQALQAHFHDVQVINIPEWGVQRIRWPLPAEEPLASIIIPAHNASALTRNCIDSILQNTLYVNYEVLLVDNRSDDPAMLDYLQQLRQEPKVKVIQDPRPFNFSQINNDAVKACKGEVLLFLNNDVEVINPDWLTEMVSQAMRPEIGCVGAKLYYADGRIQHGGVIIGYGGVAGHAHKFFPGKHPGYMKRLVTVQNFSAVTAACMAVRREIFEQVGGFDEVNLTVAFNDVDLCLKVQEAGYRNLWTPYAELYHHESVSRGLDLFGEKKRRFEQEIDHMKRRWNTDKGCDPAYNPNLAIDREDFAMRIEQR
jgi:GT2 family glycosyltransferase